MKRFLRTTAALAGLALLSMTGSKALAVGWPSKYQGVMLQGFYWDSYSVTGWSQLTAQADELSKYFSLIWVPNSARGASSPGMGYDPVYWFTNHNTSFGTETALREMIKTYKSKGVGIIEDVVVNHRSGATNWYNFPAEQWNGTTWQISTGSICSTDEGFNSEASNANIPASYRGNPDTGEDFNGSRDLDHTNANVQNNIKNYCKFLIDDLGYAGFRLDMVKGYGGQYTKIYNQYSRPQFCVGEYFDGNYDAVAAWIEATGKESAAFDFPCKFQINQAFAENDMTKLVWKANGVTDQPAGMIHFGYPQFAVTFVDNHDTYRDHNKFTNDSRIVAANAFILFSPGTPCVFWKHYADNKAEIQRLISLRNEVGIHNESAVRVLRSSRDCYMAEITGTKGKAVVKIGSAMASPDGYNDSQIKASGTDYCVWTTTQGGTGGGGNTGSSFTVYYDNSLTNWATPHIHYWGSTESTWPGVAMTKYKDNVWSYTVPSGTTGLLFNAGDGDPTKTADFSAQANHIYTKNGDQGVYSDGNGGNGGGNTGSDFSVYFDNTTSGWATPYIHYWGASESTWPGVAMNKYKDNVWSYTVPAGTTGLLFNAGDGDPTKTADFMAQANHIYTTSGDQGVYSDGNGGNGNGNSGSAPTQLYILGNINGTEWSTSAGIPMTKEGNTYSIVCTVNDAGQGAGYFNLSTALGASWDELNMLADRYGAVAPDTPLSLGGSADMMLYALNVNASGCQSWMVAPGQYRIVADFSTMKVSLYDPAGIESISNDSEIEPIYFNMQGMRVAQPQPGNIYIRVRGTKSDKVIVK